MIPYMLPRTSLWRLSSFSTIHSVSIVLRRKQYAANIVARFEKGGFREKWIGLGASDEDIDAVIRDAKAWAADEDGWFAILQNELICRV